jgi:hypothetical protein
VIVAMTAMGVVKTAVHEVIDVIAMRHGFMTAAWSMAMGVLVDLFCATHRILGIHLDDMLFGMSAARMHKAAIVQIVHVVPMADSHMTTVWAVLVGARALHCLSPLAPDECVLP